MAGILRTILGRSKGPIDDYWYQPWFYAQKTAAGEQMTPQLAETIGAVFACKRLLSEGVATIPLNIYRRRSDGGKTRAEDLPIYRLLHDAPNEFQTSTEFREWLQGDVVMRGRAYAEIVRDRGRIISLLPLQFDRVRRKWKETAGLYYEVIEDSATRFLSREEVFTVEAFCGKAPIELARESFGLARALELYGARFFGNDATPNGAIQVPVELSDKAYKRLREDWQQMHSGENQHKVGMLEEGAEWKSIGLPNEHAQFLESRNFEVEEIARWFNVPAHMIQHEPSAQPRANVEQKSLEFIVYSLRPWLVRWEQAIQRDLLQDTRLFAEFTVEGLLRGDIETRYKAYSVARQWGWMSENDVRRKENMDPIEGGDNYLVPLNMIPISQLGSQAVNEENMRQAYRVVFVDAMNRVVKRELGDLRRLFASERKVPREKFRAVLERFYGSFSKTIPELIRFAVESYTKSISDVTDQKFNVNEIAGEFAQKYTLDSKRELVDLIDSNGDDPRESILNRLDQWERAGRAASLAESELQRLSRALLPGSEKETVQ